MGQEKYDHRSGSLSSLSSAVSHDTAPSAQTIKGHNGEQQPNHPSKEYSRKLPDTLRAVRDGTASLPTNSKKLSGGRTLVICLDGTGDQFDGDNSSIVLFVSCLLKHTPAQQVTYYQSGIGTYDKGGLTNGIAAGMDMAVGSGLGESNPFHELRPGE